MNNPFLWSQMLEIQSKYRLLIIKLQDYIYTDDFRYAINEISIFWYSHKKIVELFLEHVSENNDAFLLCGASYLDIYSNEHLPFLATGNIHIVDDPLSKFAYAIKHSMNQQFYETMKQQIISAFSDNKEILDKMLGEIIILPVSSAIEDIGSLNNAENAMTVMSSMLNEEIDPRQLFKISDFNLLISKFKKESLDTITFSDDDIPEEPIKDRFERYLSLCGDPFGEIPLSQKLIHSILGYFMQTLDILAMCAQYSLLPYIRSDVVFKYMSIIGMNFTEISQVRRILGGMLYAHSIYSYFDVRRVSIESIENYISSVENVLKSKRYWNPEIAEEPITKENCDRIRISAQNLVTAIYTALA